MPTLTVVYNSEAERQAYEKAIGFASEMIQLGLLAPDGTVLDACEELTLTKGREFLRETLASAVQARRSPSNRLAITIIAL